MGSIDMNYRKLKKQIKKRLDKAMKLMDEHPLSSTYISMWREAYRDLCRLKAERLKAKGKI